MVTAVEHVYSEFMEAMVKREAQADTWFSFWSGADMALWAPETRCPVSGETLGGSPSQGLDWRGSFSHPFSSPVPL